MLNPQLPHVPMAASSDLRAIRMTQCDTLQFQKAYRRIHADLFGLAQFIPPSFKFAGVEHRGHELNIAQEEYRVKGMLSPFSYAQLRRFAHVPPLFRPRPVIAPHAQRSSVHARAQASVGPDENSSGPSPLFEWPRT